MAQDVYLKIDGIAGESTDAKHKDQIEVLSFSFGASNPVHIGSAGAGAGTGKVSMQDLSFMMHYNKSSPALLMACATGKHIKDATLFLRKAGGTQQEYLTYKMTEVFVSSYQTGASSEMPTDSISMAFGKVEVEYQQQDEKGSVGKPVKVGWNLKENKVV
jgi:type VI secretion system secreted protein Hcp